MRSCPLVFPVLPCYNLFSFFVPRWSAGVWSMVIVALFRGFCHCPVVVYRRPLSVVPQLSRPFAPWALVKPNLQIFHICFPRFFFSSRRSDSEGHRIGLSVGPSANRSFQSVVCKTYLFLFHVRGSLTRCVLYMSFVVCCAV